MKTYRLPEDVRDALLKYLMGRPWVEVYQGIEALQALEEIGTEQERAAETRSGHA